MHVILLYPEASRGLPVSLENGGGPDIGL
ncbi:hypothetical protein B14911_07008 [Bacillus sp. NRRL B-14911]|nr:hypothetical protein B14911_07008 [Bacillus sp. NRRL B-14911]